MNFLNFRRESLYLITLIKCHHVWNLRALCQWISTADDTSKIPCYVLNTDKTVHLSKPFLIWDSRTICKTYNPFPKVTSYVGVCCKIVSKAYSRAAGSQHCWAPTLASHCRLSFSFKCIHSDRSKQWSSGNYRNFICTMIAPKPLNQL